MSNHTIDKLIWVLIYAGLFVAGLGVWFMEHSMAVGWTMILFGAGSVVAGAVLIWVRSRRS
jgi:vacuolar-type H+-ATPase subunit I/STV1